MPSSDYTNTVGGGLKLKGARDAGVKKKKKKDKSKSKIPESIEQSEVPPVTEDETEQDEGGEMALQKALAEEDQDVGESSKERENDVRQFGKTEAQRRHEERRRKRVCFASYSLHTRHYRGRLC